MRGVISLQAMSRVTHLIELCRPLYGMGPRPSPRVDVQLSSPEGVSIEAGGQVPIVSSDEAAGEIYLK